jgi:hypothetical protein
MSSRTPESAYALVIDQNQIRRPLEKQGLYQSEASFPSSDAGGHHVGIP